jgi:nucleoside-diphosphate-sugar epimerase
LETCLLSKALILPSIQSPLGALPARFRRPRVLIVGCGDVGLRVAGLLKASSRLMALTSSSQRVETLQHSGITPMLGDLDKPHTLRRLAGIATHVVHMAPPPLEGHTDPRTRALVLALRLRSLPSAVVYGSTTGVYGDCAGEWIDETRRLQPQTARAQRRVDAQDWVNFLGKSGFPRTQVLRIPGIYAMDREGGTPRERLLRGTPVLQAQEDVYTNHIHADDLARATVLAMWRGKPLRPLNICDQANMKMGDYMDSVAAMWGLAKPPRISREQANLQLSPMVMSFLNESRRIRSDRMTQELRLRLKYPTVMDGLQGKTS